MDSLDDIQRNAVLQLRELINGADEDVAVGVLSSVEWDVQVCLSTNPTWSISHWYLYRKQQSSSLVPLLLQVHQYLHGFPMSRHLKSTTRTRESLPHHDIRYVHTFLFFYRTNTFPQPPYSLLRPVWSILAFPLHILSSVFRFIFGVLRIPFPQFRFTSLNFYRPLRPRASARGGPDRWLRELEEETGAISISRSNLPRATTSSVNADPGQSSLTARSSNVPTEDGRKLLPDFTICSYEEMLRTCQREAKIGCVILVSEEHDDVPAFKR